MDRDISEDLPVSKTYEVRFDENIKPLKIKLTGLELKNADLNQLIKENLPPIDDDDTVWLLISPYIYSRHEISDTPPDLLSASPI